MKKKLIANFIVSGILFFLFILLTILVLTVDVQPVGANNSDIGLATINKAIFNSFGVNMTLYHVTEIISAFAIVVAIGFAMFGIVQLFKRKNLKKVDAPLLLLGIFYLITAACYLLFEFVIVNYRPIILDGGLASSYPSSTTLTVVCIMGSAIILFNNYFKNRKYLKIVSVVVSHLIIITTVVGRLVSGVHWFTDILGGVLLSAFLIMLYYSYLKFIEFKTKESII